MTAERERAVISARLYGAVFLLGALLLVVLNLWGPPWSAPVVLIVLGLLSVVLPRPTRETRETERIDPPDRARRSTRRFGTVAVVAGVALLLRSLGML